MLLVKNQSRLEWQTIRIQNFEIWIDRPIDAFQSWLFFNEDIQKETDKQTAKNTSV